jgi:hypothetical protein
MTTNRHSFLSFVSVFYRKKDKSKGKRGQIFTGCPKMQNCKNSDFDHTERGRKTPAEIIEK